MLLDDIITLLGDEKSNLSAALLKTKILLHQIGKRELAEWVNQELNGYGDDDVVPDYRILPSEVRGNAASIAWSFSDHPIPTSHMTDFFKEHFLRAKMRQSLTVLEDMSAKSGSLRRTIPMEYNGKLSEVLVDGVMVTSAWCTTPTHDVKGILTQVRSRLLDFALELKSSMGDVVNDDDLKKEATKVDAAGLFNNAVFGHNTTIVVGNHNTQNVKNSVKAGDLNSLVKTLSDAGIPAEDIEDLKSAIAADEAEEGKASFEGKTGSWMSRMLGKAAKGTLKLTTDVASNVIATAISAYIGLTN